MYTNAGGLINTIMIDDSGRKIRHRGDEWDMAGL